jgi:hypothetical protein
VPDHFEKSSWIDEKYHHLFRIVLGVVKDA